MDTLTREEKLEQVDALQVETILLETLINTYSEQIKHSESTIRSILETIPRESNPVADRMLSLIDDRDGWTYDDPVIKVTTGSNRRINPEYNLVYGNLIYIKLYCGLLSEGHTTCLLNYYKIIPMKEENIRNAHQVFKDLDWNTVGQHPIYKDVSEGITKELDISELTDEQITAELDKIELSLTGRFYVNQLSTVSR